MSRKDTRGTGTQQQNPPTPQTGNDGHAGEEKNRPVFSVGPIMTDQGNSVSAAVWDRQVQLDGGREFTAFAVTCEATYKDKEGDWQKSGSFRSNQLPVLIYCLQRCFDWVQSQRDPKQNTE